MVGSDSRWWYVVCFGGFVGGGETIDICTVTVKYYNCSTVLHCTVVPAPVFDRIIQYYNIYLL